MATDPITSAAATTSASKTATDSQTGTSAGSARLAENFETFLTLLTTQLKNQDPLSPLDSNQFTQQIVQLTGVEQQLLTNDLLKKLVDTSGRGISEAVNLIGKDVKADASTATLKDGKADWLYNLASSASSVRVDVLDSTGRVVHTESVSGNGKGEHPFSWDGKDLNGRRLPDGGVYTLQVSAKDASGGAVASNVLISGRVTGVETADGDTLITVNGSKVSWTAVTSITAPAVTAATTTNTGGQTPSAQAA